jgi:RNA polymerase sigma factor (sigma-70 family)
MDPCHASAYLGGEEVLMAEDPLEEDLVRRARAGEQSVGPLLVSLLGERLLGYARAHAPDLSDPDREQIVEMAIEAGVRAMPSFDPRKGTVFSWFRQQVRYKTLDWRRAHVPALPVSDLLSEPERPARVDDTKAALVRHAMAKLSTDDQDVLALRHAEGLTHADIAMRLSITEEAARQRHKRAIGRLRVALEESPAGDPDNTAKEG